MLLENSIEHFQDIDEESAQEDTNSSIEEIKERPSPEAGEKKVKLTRKSK